MPDWLQRPREEYIARGPNTLRGYDYAKARYYATPPWLSKSQRAQMRAIKKAARDAGKHADHEVPLIAEDVCGLNVPWNLVPLDPIENMSKGNRWWPHMARGYQQDLLDPFRFQPFELVMT